MPRLTLAIAIFLLLTPAVRAGEFEDGLLQFRQASATTDPEKARQLFRKSAVTFEALIDPENESTRLLTNIGNARAFTGDLGEAVLAYRRALLVDPGNERARDALDTVRRELGIEESGANAGSGLLHALFFWHDSMPLNTRRILFAVAWIAGILLLLLSLRTRRLRAVAGLVLAIALALFISLVISDLDRKDASDAVLLVRTEGRTGDGEFYSRSHTAPLPAGVELRILERRPHEGGWVRGELRDGTTTWLPAASVEEVIPHR